LIVDALDARVLTPPQAQDSDVFLIGLQPT
jgi:hypothetical protein